MRSEGATTGQTTTEAPRTWIRKLAANKETREYLVMAAASLIAILAAMADEGSVEAQHSIRGIASILNHFLGARAAKPRKKERAKRS
jgi:hypothetical protein